jgi:hypothetical protein
LARSPGLRLLTSLNPRPAHLLVSPSRPSGAAPRKKNPHCTTAPLPLAVALFWIGLNLVAFYEASRQWPLLSQLWEALIFLLRTRHDVRAIVGAMWLLHALEAGAAVILCASADLPGKQIAGWALVTGLMGFGVLPGLRRDVRRATEAHRRGVRKALASAG